MKTPEQDHLNTVFTITVPLKWGDTSWEEQFEEHFAEFFEQGTFGKSGVTGPALKEGLKDFISKTLEKERKELIEKLKVRFANAKWVVAGIEELAKEKK